MYKVMIVDDEPIIVEGLSRSIAWDKWNCKVVATAHDGLEGKKSIEEYRPDIIFMDINLENSSASGIDLIHKVNFLNPSCQVIYISQYLEYASDVYDTRHTYFMNKERLSELLGKALHTAFHNLWSDYLPSPCWSHISVHPQSAFLLRPLRNDS